MHQPSYYGGGHVWFCIDSSPIRVTGNVMSMALGFASVEVLSSTDTDGNPFYHEKNHVIFLPLTTVTDPKSGDEVANAVLRVAAEAGIAKEDFIRAAWVFAGDGGGENTGNVRDKGSYKESFRGKNGVFQKLLNEDALFMWCACHIGNLHVRDCTPQQFVKLLSSSSKLLRAALPFSLCMTVMGTPY